WDCAGYWSVAHPVALGHTAPAGCTSTATMSRLSVYQYEINSGYVSDLSPGVTVTTGRNTTQVKESGAPRCSSTPAPSTCGRRVLYSAMSNCNSLGQPLQGAPTNVPVVAFAKFFLTLPVPTSTSPVYAE